MGIDTPIQQAIRIFTAHLWVEFSNQYKGRAFNIDGKPAEYLGSNNYQELTFDDRYASLIFFNVDSQRDRSFVNVTIHVACNIGTIYGASTRATEEAHNAVVQALRFTPFEVESLITGLDSLEQFEKITIEDMQPFYVFSIKTTVPYKLFNC